MEEERLLYPITMTDGSTEAVTPSKRDAPPAHYAFRIESFSQLSEFLIRFGKEKYESREFEVGGYKWKLSLYPNGDKKRNGRGHISLYLVLSEKNNLSFGSEVNAFFILFAYDQIRDKYLTVQDNSKKIRFHAMKTEAGFSQFLPLATFNDASNGYLVDDCCIFGVEVFLKKYAAKGESVSTNKPKQTITHTMENFSKLESLTKIGSNYSSSQVKTAGHDWCLDVCPCGETLNKGKYLCLYLRLQSSLSPEEKVWVVYTLRVKNQEGGKHRESTFTTTNYSASNRSTGTREFLLLSDLKDKSKGYIKKDTVIVEVDIVKVLTIKDF